MKPAPVSLDFYGASVADVAAALALVYPLAIIPGAVASLDCRSFSRVPLAMQSELAERVATVARDTFALECRDGEYRPIMGAEPLPIVRELASMLEWWNACRSSIPAGRVGSLGITLAPTGGAVTAPEHAAGSIAYYWAFGHFGDASKVRALTFYHQCAECSGSGKRPHARIRGRFVKCEACNGAAESAPVNFPSLPVSSIPAALRRCFP